MLHSHRYSDSFDLKEGTLDASLVGPASLRPDTVIDRRHAPKECLPRDGLVLSRYEGATVLRLQSVNDWEHQVDGFVSINRPVFANMCHSTFHFARVDAEFLSAVANSSLVSVAYIPKMTSGTSPAKDLTT